MLPSTELSQWGRERGAERSVVPGLSCTMEGGHHDPEDQGTSQGSNGVVEPTKNDPDHTGLCRAPGQGDYHLDTTDYAHAYIIADDTAHSGDSGNAAPSGHQDYDLQLQPTGGARDRQEVRTHSWEAFLQVPTEGVRLLPLGSSGDRDLAAVHSSAIKCNQSRSREFVNNDGGSAGRASCRVGQEGLRDQPARGRFGACAGGGQVMHDGGGPPESVHAAGAGGDACGPAQVLGGSSSVDVSGRRRGTHAEGHERPSLPPGDRGASNGIQEAVGAGEGEVEASARASGECEALWRIPLENHAQHNRAVLQQIRNLQVGEPTGMITERFWLKDLSGQTTFHKGILPVKLPENGSQPLVNTIRELPEDDMMDEVEKTLAKGCRKRLQRTI